MLFTAHSVLKLQEVAHRRPYETVLIAAHPGHEARKSLPEDFCILSVPGEHSRKPHLGRLLERYLPDRPKCMEVGTPKFLL